MKDSKSSAEKLMKVLLDRSAEYGDRSDAALDLANFDTVEVVGVLWEVVLDEDSDQDLVETAIDTLYTIIARKDVHSSEYERKGD
jgi:hypothetical protein